MWSKDFHERLTSDDLAKSVAEAERLLASHKERKVKSDWMINIIILLYTYDVHSLFLFRVSWTVGKRISTGSLRRERYVL